ncbi:MAG: cyclic-di-AMP receptor [Lachnospiraceae bacterium]|nr:cyclic-di-AMP receptor [Lachnospiraceae bacterium]
MKLILAIVNNDDSALASSALTEAGFVVTKLSTTGGFLMVGNTTLLIGTDDDGVAKVTEILKKYCNTRKQVSSPTASFGAGLKHMSLQEEVKVGGATIFVLEVAHMEKI